MPAFSLAHTPPQRSLGGFTLCTTLPYPPTQQCECRGFGGVLEPHYIVGAEPLDQ